MKFKHQQGNVVVPPSINPDHESLRAEIAAHVDAYLARGGKISAFDSDHYKRINTNRSAQEARDDFKRERF